MNKIDQDWLDNRISAAVDDDFYLDRDEEKRIREEASARGIAIKDIDLSVKSVIDFHGAVSERVLLDELDRLLHQFTDNDKELDNKEERDALDKVLRPAMGKKKGLDPREAEAYVHSFCKSNGIKRTTETRKYLLPVVGVSIAVIVIVIGVGVVSILGKSTNSNNGASSQSNTMNSSLRLSDEDKFEIDEFLRHAAQYIDKGQYTDPPEKSAKAALDGIKQLDPTGQYQADKVKALEESVVEHYLALADKSYAVKDIEGVKRWLARAKLFSRNTESILDKERQFGFLPPEGR